eukprot:Polyplicarium_translucidae@DN2119_c0_g1_i3.p4
MQFDFSCGDLQALRNAAGVPPLCESPHISSDRSRNTDTFPVFSSGSVGVGQPHISSDQSRNEDGFSPLFSPRYTDLGAPHISSDRSRNEDAFCVSAGGWMPPSSDRSRGAFSPPISPMGVVSVDEGSSDGEFEGSQRVRLTPLPRGQKWRGPANEFHWWLSPAARRVVERKDPSDSRTGSARNVAVQALLSKLGHVQADTGESPMYSALI